MRLTKHKALSKHRKMWLWIADETSKQKRKVWRWEYFKAHGIMDVPHGKCCSYCCEYSNHNCTHCLIDWGGKLRTCIHKDSIYDRKGLYAQWNKEPDYIKAAELAKQIAELPERK